MNVVSKLLVAATSAPSTVRVNLPSSRVAALRSRVKTPGVILVTVFSSSKLTVVSAAATSTIEGGISCWNTTLSLILNLSQSDDVVVTYNDCTEFTHSDIKTSSNSDNKSKRYY